MRQITFRGRNQCGEWFYGDLWQFAIGECAISTPQYGTQAVEPDSVGQYTGFKDKNGREIYEGDVLTFPDSGRVDGPWEDGTAVVTPWTRGRVGWSENTGKWVVRALSGEGWCFDLCERAFISKIVEP